MANQKKIDQSETQGARRTKYGLNVAVGAVAALGVVVIINVIAYQQLRRVPPLDLTATGQYSLSPQTRKILGNLKSEYRIVTLFGSSDPSMESENLHKAADLIDQYARHSKNVKTDHINADLQAGRVEDFFAKLRDRYKEALTPIDDAARNYLKAVGSLREQAAKQTGDLRAAVTDANLNEGQLSQFLQAAAQTFSRLDAELEGGTKQIKKSLSMSLPNYSSVRAAIENDLNNLDEKLYSPLILEFEKAAKIADTAGSVRERLLGLNEQFKGTRGLLREQLGAIRSVKANEEYDLARNAINDNPNPVVVVGPKSVRVTWLGKMFRQPDPGQVQPGEKPELLFQGEERITGMFVSMSMERQPLVVLISSGGRAALGPGGEYENLAQRLTNMTFQVRSWSAAGRTGPMGQPMPPEPPPAPAEGQKVVWVLLPAEPANPMELPGPGEQQTIEFLEKRLELGDCAMVMLGASPTARFGDASPAQKVVESWGIVPQLDRVVLREFTAQDGKTRASGRFDLVNWSSELPVTAALAGMPGVFVQASPMTIEAKPGGDVTVWPLVKLTGDSIWAEKNLDRFPDVKRDPATALNEYIIAAAAQRGEQRLIVIADPLWANNYVTTNADRYLRQQGVGMAEYFGAAFPANAELFVNSVQWLAGLEQLIAASARSQDIRRIMPMTPVVLVTLQWSIFLGMPLGAVIAGTGVWMARRRG